MRYMLAGVDQSYDLLYSSSTNWRTRIERKQKKVVPVKAKAWGNGILVLSGPLIKANLTEGEEKKVS